MSFANPHRGECALEIGGRERVLVMNYNTLARIEQEAGVSYLFDPEDLDAQKALESKMRSVTFVRIAVAAALSYDRRVVRPEQVGEWLSEPGKLVEAFNATSTALSRFFAGIAAAKKQDESPAQLPGPLAAGADKALPAG